MSVQLEKQISDDEDDDVVLTRREILFSQMRTKGNKWPKTIGIVEIVVGFILSILGALEIFIIPLSESKDGENLVVMDETNTYGAGFFAGFVMVLTGSTALRATMSQRDTTVVRFFNLTILSLLAYAGLTLWLITAYSNGWTSPDKYKPGSRMKEVHMFVTIFAVLGLIFATTSFVQYIKVICCGEVPLWSIWLSCLCPCVYGKVMKCYSLLHEMIKVSPQKNQPRSFDSRATLTGISATNESPVDSVESSTVTKSIGTDLKEENSVTQVVVHL